MDVKEIVEKYGVKLAELSEMTGVHRSYLWQLMVGRLPVTVEMEQRLQVGLRKLIMRRADELAAATTALVEDGVKLKRLERKPVETNVRKMVGNLGLNVVVDEVAADG